MRKALLVYLYSKDEAGLSLALGFLKAYADADEAVRRTWSIEILNQRVDADPGELTVAIERTGADLVAFSCYTWNIRAVEQVIAGLARERKPTIVLGGVEVTPDPEKGMQRHQDVDVIVVGEGEATFCALLRRLGEDPEALSRGRLDDIKGIAWRHGKSIHVNDPRRPIEDLTTIPSPYLSGTYGDEVKKVRTVPMETVRGCPYQCKYCFEGRGFKTMRAFPLERVREEVKHLVGMGVTEIEFFDTNVNHDRKRALELFRFLRTMGKRLLFWFELRAELIDEELAKALGALQFFGEIGLQTTNPKALKAVNRTLDRDKFETGTRSLLEASIYRPCGYSPRLGVAIDMIAGLPHDSISDILDTFDYTFQLVPAKIMVGMMKLLPGTGLYSEAGTFNYDFDPDDEHVIRSSSTLSSQDVEMLIHFCYAVSAVYNKIHAVRTTGWVAQQLGIRPSWLFMDLGRLMACRGMSWRSLTVKDLADLLAEICRELGNPSVSRKVIGKLTAETILNSLQFLREKWRGPWTRWLFALGYRTLTFIRILSPLPQVIYYEDTPARRSA